MILLDALTLFGKLQHPSLMVTGSIRAMDWCGRITDAIVVVIGDPENHNLIEAFRVWAM